MTIQEALPLLILALVAFGALWLNVISQEAAREREAELFKLIRNLQNRLQARNLAEYETLEDREPKPPKPAEAVTEELVNEVLSNRFTPADGMNL